MNEFMFCGPAGSGNIGIGSYPSGEPLISTQPLGEVTRLLLRPQSIASFYAALCWVDAFAERRGYVPELILPFVPGARQDRLNDSGDVLFTVKSVARAINSRNFPCVTVLDPHSDVTPALIDRCRVVHADACISPPAGKYVAVISPDGGAEKRAGRVARKLGLPLVHAWKTREVATGKISGFGMEPYGFDPGARVLVVDDICDGGGTFLGLADAIFFNDLHYAPRVRRDLYVTHGLFTQGTGKLLSRYDHVYCTDSIAAERPNVIEVKVCERLLKGETL